jgi:hypothetical protein
MLSTQTIYDNSKLYNSLISYRKKKNTSFLGTPLYIVIIKLICGVLVLLLEIQIEIVVAAAAWCVETLPSSNIAEASSVS